jgi:hypothetical protein
MEWKSRAAQERYLRNDFQCKLAWSMYQISQGKRGISGILEEAFKGFDIQVDQLEYEVMRSTDPARGWIRGSFPWPFYQLPPRKIPEKYKKTANCKQFYVMFRADWRMAQVIPADVEWVKRGKFYVADASQSWEIPIPEDIANLAKAAEVLADECIEFGKREAKAA